MDLNFVSRRNECFKKAYLAACAENDVKPADDLLAALSCQPSPKHKKKFLFRRLSLCHADIGDKHFQAIIKALDQNGEDSGIHELIFNHNNITDLGVCDYLIPYLNKQKEVIQTLELFGNKVGDLSCRCFGELLKTNPILQRLKLGDNCITTLGTEALAEGLRGNRTLIQLHIGGNNIGDIGVKSLAQALENNTTLTSLGLRDNDIGCEGMESLSWLLSLACCRLQEVQLRGNKIGTNGCLVLAKAIACNSSLRVLELQSNQISAEGAKSLCDALKLNGTIHTINLNDNLLGDEGIEFIAGLLLVNTNITHLTLTSNNIAHVGAIALKTALLQNNSLLAIDLSDNILSNHGAGELSVALESNTTLVRLDLSTNMITSEGIVSIAAALARNNTLRHLDLGKNQTCNEGAIALAKALSANSSLTRLCLTDNEITQEGGKALCLHLQNNKTLRNFNYGGQGKTANKIPPDTRKQINSVITRNRRDWHALNNSDALNDEDEIVPVSGRRSSAMDWETPREPVSPVRGNQKSLPTTPKRNTQNSNTDSPPHSSGNYRSPPHLHFHSLAQFLSPNVTRATSNPTNSPTVLLVPPTYQLVVNFPYHHHHPQQPHMLPNRYHQLNHPQHYHIHNHHHPHQHHHHHHSHHHPHHQHQHPNYRPHIHQFNAMTQRPVGRSNTRETIHNHDGGIPAVVSTSRPMGYTPTKPVEDHSNSYRDFNDHYTPRRSHSPDSSDDAPESPTLPSQRGYKTHKIPVSQSSILPNLTRSIDTDNHPTLAKTHHSLQNPIRNRNQGRGHRPSHPTRSQNQTIVSASYPTSTTCPPISSSNRNAPTNSSRSSANQGKPEQYDSMRSPQTHQDMWHASINTTPNWKMEPETPSTTGLTQFPEIKKPSHTKSNAVGSRSLDAIGRQISIPCAADDTSDLPASPIKAGLGLELLYLRPEPFLAIHRKVAERESQSAADSKGGQAASSATRFS